MLSSQEFLKISSIDQPNKIAYLANLIKINSIKVLDSLPKEFLLRVKKNVFCFNFYFLSQCSLEILKKAPNERTTFEQGLLVKCTQDIQFFKEYIEKGESSIHVNCCKSMLLLSHEAGEVVFYKGTNNSNKKESRLKKFEKTPLAQNFI